MNLLLKLLGQDSAEPVAPALDENLPNLEDDKIFQLRMKKKVQAGIIRKMMEESGYGDLAKMTNVSKREFEE